ncbi:MAG: thioredoxin [Clostridia bacterium]|nr:thioredoxin [Clostridia bacterium]
MSVIEVNQTNFDKEVLQSDQKVLVDFNADWCGPCQMLKPVLTAVASNNPNVKFVSVNVDVAPELAKQYGIMSIPCLILFDHGNEINRHVGFVPKSLLESMVNDN